MRLLALTHISPRYFGPEIAREAREVFAQTVVPRDFDVIDVPFRERGEPTLVRGGAVPEWRADEPAPAGDSGEMAVVVPGESDAGVGA